MVFLTQYITLGVKAHNLPLCMLMTETFDVITCHLGICACMYGPPTMTHEGIVETDGLFATT